MKPRGTWAGRIATGEALLWLGLARLAVRFVPFGRWRKTLGRPAGLEPRSPAGPLDANLHPRRLARAVGRAAGRLPGQSRCLPQAMALQWMLRIRGIDSVLHIGIAPGTRRGGLDDLHAWVSRHGEVLLGAHEAAHVAIFSAEGAI